MQSDSIQPMPVIRELPVSFPRDGAINLEIEQGMPVLRIADSAQKRVEYLLSQQRESSLSNGEEAELQNYEEIDDYLSYINRLIRNLATAAKAA